jgi:hypothetical protein
MMEQDEIMPGDVVMYKDEAYFAGMIQGSMCHIRPVKKGRPRWAKLSDLTLKLDTSRLRKRRGER